MVYACEVKNVALGSLPRPVGGVVFSIRCFAGRLAGEQSFSPSFGFDPDLVLGLLLCLRFCLFLLRVLLPIVGSMGAVHTAGLSGATVVGAGGRRRLSAGRGRTFSYQ